ncbi:MAG: glycoside hydrolase family 5 protein [Treponema sp.]|nr:glycoside hydrolase family 5 protein [Treponema sp.]
MWYGFNVLWFFSAGWKPGEIHVNPNMIRIDENELDFMAEMGCNFVRVPCDYRFFIHDFKYDEYDEKMLKCLDAAIEKIVSRGMHCSLNVHRGPGYCINGNELEKHNLWKDAIAQDAFTNLWTMFASRYKNYSKDQLSFDLLNEPPSPGQYGLTREIHKAIMARVVESIRKVSPDREIICDGLCGGHVAAPELADLGVTMSGRGYQPFKLTHYQAEWNAKDGSMDWPYPQWPGMEADGKKWNRDALLEFYKPWKEMKDNGCKVHIGECGVYNKVRNETALAWYEDFFSVCNELGFGWALWNFRGPFGIVEHRRENTNWKTMHGMIVDVDLYEMFKKHMI